MLGDASCSCSTVAGSSGSSPSTGGAGFSSELDQGDQDSEPGGQTRAVAALNSKAAARPPFTAERYRVALVTGSHTVADEPDNAKKALRGALETVRCALEKAGHQVSAVDVKAILTEPAWAKSVDLCFIVTEGDSGSCREMQVPAVVEMLGIRYAGSGPLSLGQARDVESWKVILQGRNIRTAPYQVFKSAAEVVPKFDHSLKFPLIVKLSKCTMLGNKYFAVAQDITDLATQAQYAIENFCQPIYAETYLPGYEYVVGIIGNKPQFGEAPDYDFYDYDGYHVFPVSQMMSHEHGDATRYAPADLPKELCAEMQHIATEAFEALQCSDIATIRFRVDDRTPYVVGVNNVLGDIIACTDGVWLNASGVSLSYDDLVREVIHSCLRRSSKTVPAASPRKHVTVARCTSYRRSDVADELWNDWRWQMANRLTKKEQFQSLFELTQDEVAAFDSAKHFPVACTPYFASLIDPKDPNDPIRKQVLPSCKELEQCTADMEDSLSEDEMSPVPGVTHRYPDRCLMLVSMICASYCRFCTRNRVVGTNLQTLNLRTSGKQTRANPREFYETELDYIRKTPAIRDVLLSGGDPLLLPKKTLDYLLSSLWKIPHVQVVRIGTRVPIFLPQRITPSLCNVLKRYHPLWLNTHVNHPNELSPTCSAGLARLADAGIPLGCQTVLLAGINDCPNIMKALVQKLVRNRVRPYNLYQCDLVVGAEHFRTPVSKGLEVIEALRGHTSGFAVPTFIIDTPFGGGKVPVLPNYVISQSESKVIVRNYEGFISTYTCPRTYEHHERSTCSYCKQYDETHPGAQESVCGLLQDHGKCIKPSGFDKLHHRKAEVK